MADNFNPWGSAGPRTTIVGGPGAAPGNAQIAELARRVRDFERDFERLQKDPRPCGVVVEVRDRDMMLAFGPANTLMVQAIADVRVGDRVLCNRNTMQAIELLPRDTAPAGSIVTCERVSDNKAYVEASLMNILRSFKAPETIAIVKGDRIVLDPSNTYVIGNLGKPPAAFSMSPKVSVSWDDVGGQADAKAALREAIELPLSHPALFKEYGKRGVKGVLLMGPPGCGKTILAKAAATSIAKAHGHAAAAGFIYIKGPELLNPYIGKSEESIRALFTAARNHKAEHGYPSVVFIDECDALLGVRDRGVNVSVNATTVPQFLAEMDGLDDAAAMFILATNRPDALDPAVVREGRVDRKVRVDRPNKADSLQIMELHLRGRPLGKGAVATAIATTALEHVFDDARVIAESPDPTTMPSLRLRDVVNGAMLAEVVERASTRAILRDIEGAKQKAGGVTSDDLVWAVDKALDAAKDMLRGNV